MEDVREYTLLYDGPYEKREILLPVSNRTLHFKRNVPLKVELSHEELESVLTDENFSPLTQENAAESEE